MKAKETIDIEALLTWAYRDQCVDRATGGFTPKGPSVSVACALGQFAALGTRVDTSSLAAVAMGGRTPDDAMVVHDMVLSLDDAFVQWTSDGDVVLWDRAMAAAEGCAIEETPRGPVLHADDGTQARLTKAVTVALLVKHAKNGDRPEVYAGWKPPVGRPAIRHDAKGAAMAGDAWEPCQEDVEYHRALYAVWHAGLRVLAADLADLLDRFDVIGPSAPESPWLAVAGAVHRAENQGNYLPHKPLKKRKKKAA